MKYRAEIHPGEGGADAELFASELASSVSKHFGVAANSEGRVISLERL